MRKARELLQQPPPDTFLGRRTHEPFADPPSGVLWLAKRREHSSTPLTMFLLCSM